VIPETLWDRIAPRLVGKDPDQPVLPNYSGEFHSRYWANDNCKRLCAACGVPVVTAYSLRGCHATLAIRKLVEGGSLQYGPRYDRHYFRWKGRPLLQTVAYELRKPTQAAAGGIRPGGLGSWLGLSGPGGPGGPEGPEGPGGRCASDPGVASEWV
jgi:hypothetical protein